MHNLNIDELLSVIDRRSEAIDVARSFAGKEAKVVFDINKLVVYVRKLPKKSVCRDLRSALLALFPGYKQVCIVAKIDSYMVGLLLG